MERTLITKLVEWKERSNRKPLILKGVRQCGKTYLLKEFGKRYYESCAYFNFEENEALKNVFEKGYDTSRILFELGLYFGKTIEPGKTLLILDEIQECGRAITAMKYFCENAPPQRRSQSLLQYGVLFPNSLQKKTQSSFSVT